MENYASLLSTLRRIYLNVYLLCKFHESIKRHLKVCRHLIITHSKLAQLRSVSVPARWLQWKPRHSTHVHTHNHTHVHTHNHTHVQHPQSDGTTHMYTHPQPTHVHAHPQVKISWHSTHVHTHNP